MIETFASVTQMQQRTQSAITATTHPFLETELKAATRRIRNACGWHIATREQLTYRRRGLRAPVWLPAMKIASIDSATVDGYAVDPDSIDFDDETGWTSLCGRSIDVAFTAGYTTVPADLVTLTLELAAGGLGSPLGISREQAGGVSVTLSRTTGKLTSADRDDLTPYILGRIP